jgi:hypothetical protein
MPKPAGRPVGYRQDVAEIVSGMVKKFSGVSEKKGVSGRPQFFAGERLFAFVAQEGLALKLPAEVVQRVIDQVDYLPFKMRNKPVLREWIRIKHEDAVTYKKDAPLFRQAISFVSETEARRASAAREARVPVRRKRAE